MKRLLILPICVLGIVFSSCSSNIVSSQRTQKLTVNWEHDTTSKITRYYANGSFIGEGTNGVEAVFSEIRELKEGSTVLFLQNTFGTALDGSSPAFGFYLPDDPQMRIIGVLSEKQLNILSDSKEKVAQ